MNLALYITSIIDVHEQSQIIGFRFLPITSPPFPDADLRQSKGSRNNFALAAYAREIRDQLVAKDITVFDEFSLLVTLQETVSCGYHYLCYSWEDGASNVTGDVGITALHLMMVNYVC